MVGNRRRHERFGSDMLFWIKPLEADQDFSYFVITDISAGGISCITQCEFQPGERVRLSFELPQHTDLIEAQGEVRHSSQTSDGRNMIGIAFEKVAGMPQHLLTDYLEELFR